MRSLRRPGQLVLVALIIGSAQPAALACVQVVPPLLHDTSTSCQGDPRYRRAVALGRLGWGGSSYLLEDTGNELTLFRVDDPERPVKAGSSGFSVTPNSDDDENLKAFSVCDDCRYGVAGFGLEGVVLFDLGTADQPRFGSSRQYSAQGVARMVSGGFTYKVGGQQYLMASGVTAVCPGSGLYRFDDVAVGALDLLACVSDASGVSLWVDGGFHLQRAGAPDVLYVLAYSSLHVFEIGEDGSDLTHRGSFGPAMGPPAFAVDPAARLAATADGSRISLWDLADPLAPRRVWRGVPAGASGLWGVVSLRWPLLWAGKLGRVTAGAVGHLLDVSDPTRPQPLDEPFWDAAAPWHAIGECVRTHDAELSSDGRALYLARYSIAQTFRVGSCATGAIFGADFEAGSCGAWSAEVGLHAGG